MLWMVVAALFHWQDFNPQGDRERTTGDSWLTRPHPGVARQPEPTMASFGSRAIRFSISPALRGGEQNIVTIRPAPDGSAIADVKAVRSRCKAERECTLVAVRVVNRAPFCADPTCSYDRFAARVHMLLFDVERSRSDLICTDGPGYLTELREGGITYNLAGFCAEQHANEAVQSLVAQALGTNWPKFEFR